MKMPVQAILFALWLPLFPLPAPAGDDAETMPLRVVTEDGGPVATLALVAGTGAKATMSLYRVEGKFSGEANSTGVVPLQPGTYYVTWLSLKLPHPGHPDKTWTLNSSPVAVPNGKMTVTLKPGRNTVTVGPPFRLGFTACRPMTDETQIDIEEVHLRGTAGERYEAYTHESSVKGFVRAGTREEEVCTMRYG